MSKTTDNRAFRTVDVDLYNEDNYKEEFDNEVDTGATDDNQINSLLNSHKNVEALCVFISGSPLGNSRGSSSTEVSSGSCHENHDGNQPEYVMLVYIRVSVVLS